MDKMNWILKNIFESIANIVDEGIRIVTNFINNIFYSAATLGNESLINTLENFTCFLAFTLLIIFVMKQIFSTYILETEGDPDSDPLDLIMKASVAIALIVNNRVLYDFFLTASSKFVEEILSLTTDIFIEDPFDNLQGIFNGEIIKVSDGLIVIFTLIFLIGTFILCIKGGIRGAELCLMKILFPFFCCDFVTTRKERFSAFMTSYLVTFFGYSLQILCFRISGHYFSFYAAKEPITNLLYAYAFLYLAIKTPKWLEKFVYTTGLGQTVGGGARSAAFIAPSLIRAVK